MLSVNRRSVLEALGACSVTLLAACRRAEPKGTMSSSATTTRMPVVFLAHGAPPLLDDTAWMAELRAWADRLPRPKSILVVSAHWEARPATTSATRPVPLVYDFYGFPERYYAMKYASPGAPDLAARVAALLRDAGHETAQDPDRGLDHGAWVPLVAMYPDADVPVLQLSLPGLAAKDLLGVGRALAPLRDEGVLVMGSGFLTHNMKVLAADSTPSWAKDFDAWAEDVLSRRDVDALAAASERAPSFRLAHPRSEHWAPVVVAAAAAAAGGEVTFPITGYWPLAPAFTKRSVQFG